MGENRKFFHGFLIPEFVVALVVVMIVQVIEGSLLLPVQLLEYGIILYGNSGMEFLGVVVVCDKQHVADQGVKPFFQFQAILVFFSIEISFHLSLGIKLRQ